MDPTLAPSAEGGTVRKALMFNAKDYSFSLTSTARQMHRAGSDANRLKMHMVATDLDDVVEATCSSSEDSSAYSIDSDDAQDVRVPLPPHYLRSCSCLALCLCRVLVVACTTGGGLLG